MGGGANDDDGYRKRHIAFPKLITKPQTEANSYSECKVSIFQIQAECIFVQKGYKSETGHLHWLPSNSPMYYLSNAVDYAHSNDSN